MNRTAAATTLAILMLLASAAFPSWASEGHAEEGAPAEFKTMPNPQQMTTASIKAGRSLYEKNCAECHGDTGKGDGPFAASLPVSTTDFTDAAMMKGHTDGELFSKIKNGVGEYMPVYEGSLTEDEIWHTVNYLRSISPDETREKPISDDTGEPTPKAALEEFKNLENPVPNDHAAFTGGEEIYGLYCYRCHGENGVGNNGSYAKSVLKETPHDLSDPSLLSVKTDGELVHAIKFGVGEMPPYEEYLTDIEMWQAVNYIRTFGGVEHDTTEDEGSGTTLYLGILLVALVLTVYFVKRRR